MTVSPLSESHSLQNGVLTLQMDGPVDMTTVPQIRKTILDLLQKKRVQEVHLDLSRVTVLDTSGVAMLVEIRRALSRRRAALQLTGLSEKTRRLIQLARLEQVFDIGSDPQ